MVLTAGFATGFAIAGLLKVAALVQEKFCAFEEPFKVVLSPSQIEVLFPASTMILLFKVTVADDEAIQPVASLIVKGYVPAANPEKEGLTL